MNFTALPTDYADFKDWSWTDFDPYFTNLQDRDVNADTVDQWLRNWTQIEAIASELYQRRYVALTLNTADDDIRAAYDDFLENIQPPLSMASQTLKEKLLACDTVPDGMEIPMRNIRGEAALFREENLPLLTDVAKLSSDFSKIIGAQTIMWDGEEKTSQQLDKYLYEEDRSVRETAWRAKIDRYLDDREALNEVWVKLLDKRQQIAKNAGFDNYRDYIWREKGRWDYTPDDALTFFDSIAEVVVPAATRVHQQLATKLGLDSIRPWDKLAPVPGEAIPTPFTDGIELATKSANMIEHVNPQLGTWLHQMRDEGLIDLDSRKGKGPGGYCTSFMVAGKPFIFMNAAGVATNIKTMLHEAGHGFHVYECAGKLPYYPQWEPPMEFCEVASMAMELLASPYLTTQYGGFFDDDTAKLYHRQHLEKIVGFWPYMAVVAGFQHWVYADVERAKDTANCDAYWMELWRKFMPFEDWSGLDTEAMTGWHRKLHIFRYPFYYIEYGLAQMGAVMVWKNALQDESKAVNNYRQALAYGGTKTLPDLFAAAGAKLAFDAKTLGEVVGVLETQME